MNKRIKVLHIGLSPNIGGLEYFVYNMYNGMDKNKIQFDFINVYDENLGLQEKYIDSNFYKIIPRGKNFYKHRKMLKKIIIDGKYDFVHMHIMNYRYIDPVFICNKKIKTKVIIHSHLANFGRFFSLKGKILSEINEYLIKRKKILRLACGYDAGKSLFKNQDFTIIENGIDFDKYRFNSKNKENIRLKYNIGKDDILVGHVGNFSKIKNYEFLINTFYELYKLNNNYKLILVGDYTKGPEYVELIEKLGIAKSVIYTGIVNNVNEIYSAMDLFLFPSIIEGFSIALVEAQASGVQIFYSNKIDEKSNIGGNMTLIDIDKDYKTNAEFIDKNRKKTYSRECKLDNKYSIQESANKLYNFYKTHMN